MTLSKNVLKLSHRALGFFVAVAAALAFPAAAWASTCELSQITEGADVGLGDFSGNGRYMTFSARGDFFATPRSDLYLLDLKTGRISQVTRGEAQNFGPTITHNGKVIAFNSIRPTPTGPVREVQTYFSPVNRFRTLALGQRSRISASGHRVLFVSWVGPLGPAGGWQILMANTRSGRVRQLTDLDGLLSTDFAFATRRNLAWFSSQADPLGENLDRNLEIFELDFGRRRLRQVTQSSRGTGHNDGPSVSTDGRSLLFKSSASEIIGPNPLGLNQLVLYDTRSRRFSPMDRFRGSLMHGVITGNGRRVFGVSLDLIFMYDIATDSYVDIAQATTSISGVIAVNHDGSLAAIRSNADLTGENPAKSFELFLASCSKD